MSNLFTHFLLHESVVVARDFYRPQCSCGKIIFSQASVILSTGGRIPACTGADTPPGQTLPGQTPHPPGQTSRRRPLQRTIRILHECFLVLTNFIQCVTLWQPRLQTSSKELVVLWAAGGSEGTAATCSFRHLQDGFRWRIFIDSDISDVFFNCQSHR